MTTHHHNLAAGGLAGRIATQACGSRPDEGAALIATRAMNGRLLDLVAPWVTDNPRWGTAWIDWRAVTTGAVGLSGGERRLITLAGSLATCGDDAVTVNLNDALTGLDDHNTQVVAHAITHTLGLPHHHRDQ